MQPNVILAAFRTRFVRNPEVHTLTPFGFFEAGWKARKEHTMPDLELLGRAAYAAYVEVAGGRSLVSGEMLPTWDATSPAIREAWRAAADAVVMMAGLGRPKNS